MLIANLNKFYVVNSLYGGVLLKIIFKKGLIAVLLVINILTFSGCTSGKHYALKELNKSYPDDSFEIVKVKSYNNFKVKSEKYDKEFSVKVRWGNTSESPRIDMEWIMDTDYIKKIIEQKFEQYKYDGYSFEMYDNGDILILFNDFNSIDDINDVLQDLKDYTKTWEIPTYDLAFDIGFKSGEETSILYNIEMTEIDKLPDIGEFKISYLNDLRSSGSSISKVPPNFVKENPVERAYVVLYKDKKIKLYSYDNSTEMIAGKLYFNSNMWLFFRSLRKFGFEVRYLNSEYKFTIHNDVFTLDKLNHDYYLKNDKVINFIDTQKIDQYIYISIEDMENILDCKIDYDTDTGKISIQ
jgi:hypothetical protein